jgi:hypothetical protein
VTSGYSWRPPPEFINLSPFKSKPTPAFLQRSISACTTAARVISKVKCGWRKYLLG